MYSSGYPTAHIFPVLLNLHVFTMCSLKWRLECAFGAHWAAYKGALCEIREVRPRSHQVCVSNLFQVHNNVAYINKLFLKASWKTRYWLNLYSLIRIRRGRLEEHVLLSLRRNALGVGGFNNQYITGNSLANYLLKTRLITSLIPIKWR